MLNVPNFAGISRAPLSDLSKGEFQGALWAQSCMVFYAHLSDPDKGVRLVSEPDCMCTCHSVRLKKSMIFGGCTCVWGGWGG